MTFLASSGTNRNLGSSALLNKHVGGTGTDLHRMRNEIWGYLSTQPTDLCQHMCASLLKLTGSQEGGILVPKFPREITLQNPVAVCSPDLVLASLWVHRGIWCISGSAHSGCVVHVVGMVTMTYSPQARVKGIEGSLVLCSLLFALSPEL